MAPFLPGLKRYRKLILFWTAVLSVLLLVVVAAQIAGPPVHRPIVTLDVLANGPEPVAGADPALEEPAPSLPGRMLPRIAPDGRMAQNFYAAPWDDSDKRPRIALVVGGIGLSQQESLRALRELPAAVTFVFSAYAPEEQADTLDATARQLGHECLISLPLEPRNSPRDDAGNRALLTGADPRVNAQNLEWALSRRLGCMGMTALSDGFLGETYLQNNALYSGLLHEIGKRGLAWLDPRPGAVVPDLPAVPGARLVADMVIDAPDEHGDPPSAEVIEARLTALLKVARVSGGAIGVVGVAQPLVITHLIAFADEIRGQKNVVLAPLSAMPKGSR